jgi:hypothetical protein
MNWDRIEGNWKQVKGLAIEKWGKLTDDDVDVVAGCREAGRRLAAHGHRQVVCPWRRTQELTQPSAPSLSTHLISGATPCITCITWPMFPIALLLRA